MGTDAPLGWQVVLFALSAGALMGARYWLSRPTSSQWSMAHRAWFAASGACLLGVLGVWLGWGLTLPSLQLDGLELDPAGALGWDGAWLKPRLQLAALLIAWGALALSFGVLKWVWHKKSGHLPKVVIPWGATLFLWMASLGLLMGMAHPWRQAIDMEKEITWSVHLSPSQVRNKAQWALWGAEKSAPMAIWAHALALRAYQKNAYSEKELYAIWNTLAKHNAVRSKSKVLPSPHGVGMEKAVWCTANAARQGKDLNWATEQARCAKIAGSRIWFPHPR